MKSTVPLHKSILLLIWSVVLTGVTVVLGAAPLKPVRLNLGAAPFWMLGLGLSALFLAFQIPAIGLGLLLFTILIGVWVEFEQRGFSLFQSAASALAATLSVMVAAVFFLTRKNPVFWQEQLVVHIEKFISRLSQMDANLAQTLKAEELAMQVPSAVVIIFLFSATFVAVFEKPIQKWLGQASGKKERLSDFRLPDFFMWLLISSVFFAFWNGSSKLVSAVATNVLNVLIVCYFLQGLAVLVRYFQVFRVGYFWRVLWTLIFTLQLFLVLSFVGVLDYWLDFRKKFLSRSSQAKKRSVSE